MMSKEEKKLALFNCMMRIQNCCSPVVFEIDDHRLSGDEVVCIIHEASARSLERLMTDEIKDSKCLISIVKGELVVSLY